MSKLKKQIVLSIGLVGLSASVLYKAPMNGGIYDMTPRDSFRGGSRGKGGKTKYKRT